MRVCGYGCGGDITVRGYIFFAVVGIASLLPLAAYCQTKLVALSDDKTVAIFVTDTNITDVGDYRQAWELDVFNGKGITNKVKFARLLYSYDCANKKESMIRMATYDSAKAPLGSENVTEEYSYAVPDTAMYHVMEYVCADEAGRDAISISDAFDNDSVKNMGSRQE